MKAKVKNENLDRADFLDIEFRPGTLKNFDDLAAAHVLFAQSLGVGVGVNVGFINPVFLITQILDDWIDEKIARLILKFWYFWEVLSYGLNANFAEFCKLWIDERKNLS